MSKLLFGNFEGIQSGARKTDYWGNMKRTKLNKKKKKRSPKEIMQDKAWTQFSIYVRRKNADFYGIVDCFTCFNKKHWKEMNAGHYKHGKLDFDEMNINVQCVNCNKWNSGRLDVYSMKLIDKYGLDAVRDLEQRASRAVVEKFPLEHFVEIYHRYKKINEEWELKQL